MALLARCYRDWLAHLATERHSRKALRRAEEQAAFQRKDKVRTL
jgi:hypothetical protein